MKRGGLAAMTLALACACTVGPNYKPPDVALPQRWSSSMPAHSRANEAADAHTLSEWWEELGDPVLTSLVWRAVEGNLDLYIAESRVREARGQRGVVAADAFPTIDVSSDYARTRTARNSIRFPQQSAGDRLRQQALEGVASVLAAPARALTSSIAGGGAGGGTGTTGTSPSGGANSGAAGAGIANIGGLVPEKNLFQLGFDMSWELDVFGGTRRAVEAADADIGVAQEEYRAVLVTLTGDVARGYVDLRSFQERLDIAAENIRSQDDNLRVAEARLFAGLTNELDVAQARAQLAATKSQVPTLQVGLYSAIFQIGVLLGKEPAALFDELIQSRPLPAAPPSVPAGLPSDLLRRRPDIRRAERDLAAATARIGAATADLFPRFSLTGSFGWASTNSGKMFEKDSRAWSIAPGVSWPVFDANRIRSNISVQQNRQWAAKFNYQRVVLTALREVETAMVTYTRERERLGMLEESVRANQQAVELATTLYTNGLSDFLPVLDSQRALYVTQDELARSERDVVGNLISLYKALGGGWR